MSPNAMQQMTFTTPMATDEQSKMNLIQTIRLNPSQIALATCSSISASCHGHRSSYVRAVEISASFLLGSRSWVRAYQRIRGLVATVPHVMSVPRLLLANSP
nr:hypothetical protein CFP56_33674 [Quercus suber]POE56708.1 hypothetical protein CFP56_33680 [Quercus suber]